MITQGPQRQNRAEAVLETIMRSAHPMLDWTDYRGRDRRRAFWSFALLAAVAILIGHLMDLLVFGLVPGDTPLFFAAVFGLILLPSLLASGVRRLHDTGRSGWLILLIVVPLLGWSALLVWWSQPTQPAPRRHRARA